MRAIVFEQYQGPMQSLEVPEPRVPEDGVVIRVMASGICRSDWHGWMGHDPDVKLPHVPGHEFAGVVEEVGVRVRRWKGGERVTVPFAVGCGECEPCRTGNPHICDNYYQPGFTAWGSFAERVAIPHADLNVVRLPDELGYVESASLGCRFVTAFRAVTQQARVRPGEWVVVFGCGGVGLSAVMIGRALGARVIGIDVRPEALDRARELGATHVVNSAAGKAVVHEVHELTGGGAHVSLDALGSRSTCRSSIECLRKRGRHVQVGLMLAEEREALVPMNLVIARELEILGSHGLAAAGYEGVFELINSGRMDLRKLVGKRIRLDEAPAELERMTQFNTLGATVIDRF